MLTQSRRVALIFLVTLLSSVITSTPTLRAQGRGGQATPQQAQIDPKKLNDAIKKEMLTITKMVDDTMFGQPAPNDLGLAWVRDDLLKATNNREYIPFTVAIDASKLTGNQLALYWRVVSKDQATAMAAFAPAPGKKEDKNAKRPTFTWEDIGTPTVAPGQGPLKLSRSFSAPAGTYDVYVLIKEPTSDKKGAPPAKASVIKQTVTVPDLWNEELATSSVIIAERMDPLPAPLSPKDMIERPYALGAMEIVPASSNVFTKKVELQPFLLIYNVKTNQANKPDVTVEYNFYVKDAGAEKFFNKTKPQELNAETLPPQFDFAAGHQLTSGVAVPLATFAEGEYRLEVIVTDKIANKTVKHDVNFTVSGA